MATDVTIVGGGLAGMIAAYRLLERGCRVTLFESSDRLGGKAGASIIDGIYEDHGYHIFPMWYLNIWQLIKELGMDNNFIPIEIYYQLERDDFPDMKPLKNIGSLSTAWQNATSGILPFPDMILLFYTVLDLLCHRFDKADFLDQTSVIGFIQSRFYKNQNIVNELREMILKASSAPGYRFSARTLQTIMNNEFEYPIPMFHITLESLQQSFIRPIQAKLQSYPEFTLKLQHTLTRITADAHQVKELTFAAADGSSLTHPVDKVIMTIPHGNLAPLLDGNIFENAPGLFRINYLYSAQMVAMTIYTKAPMPNLPKEHVILTASKYALSFIDIGKTRKGLEGRTVLNIVAADYFMLQGVPDADATEAIIQELQRFIPLERDNIERVLLQPHYQQPLFLNDAGTWTHRPHADRHTGLKNMYIAGDYCRSAIDLATMEGAVSTGLLAAEALRKDNNLPNPIDVLVPRRANRLLLLLGKYIALPFIVLIKLWTLLFPSPVRRKKAIQDLQLPPRG